MKRYIMQMRQPDTSLIVDDALERLLVYFTGRATVQDVETLDFTLRQLFSATDTLYRIVLAECMTSSSQKVPQIDMRYHIWDQLQQIENLLERIEPLCHLLSNTLSSLLDLLNRTCGIAPRQSAQGDDLSDPLHSGRPVHAPATTSNSRLLEQLQSWRNCNALSFVQQFANQEPATSSLEQMDHALELVRESISTIFGTILPASQADSDDEAMATLLFDIGQQIDQILLHMGALLEPLRVLIAQFTLKVGID